MDNRCTCGTRIGHVSLTGLCGSCSAKKRWARAGERESQSERMKKVLADPVRGAAMLAAGKANMRQGHIVTKVWNRGGLAEKLPPERREDHRKLSDKVGGREAYRLILEDEAIKERRRLARERDLSA